MRTLWLLRHAKASGADESTSDHDRPLDASGRDAALRLGGYLAGRGTVPERVLCSTALRARQTLEGLVPAFAAPPDCRLEPELYLASPGELLARIQLCPDAVQSLMLVAHNPGIAELAMGLAHSGDGELRRSLHGSYPSGALAELQLDADRWSEVDRGGALLSFTLPRHLPAVP